MKNKNIFGLFSNRVIELANHSFSPMYRRIFKQYWDNSMFARMRRSYFISETTNGYYEIYIPTFESIETNMKYYRVVIQVIPELSKDLLREEAKKLRVPKITPVGTVDSELLCVVAPTRTQEAKNKREFIRGYRTRSGFMVAAFLSRLPESCMKRILTVITKFLKKRLKTFLSTFHLTPQLQRDHKVNTLYYSTISYILEDISLSLANTVRCLSHSFHWLTKKIGHIYAEVGRQNQMKLALRKIHELRTVLREIPFSPSYIKGSNDPPYMKQLTVLLGVNGG